MKMKRILSRILVMALVFSLILPLPIIAGAVKNEEMSHSQNQDGPRTMAEVLFNAVAGFMGLPGLTKNPHDANADQGLGFHHDGAVRRADGTTGHNASFDGRRAAAYAGHVMDYDYYGAGYDRITGRNYRAGTEFHLPDQRYLMQRGVNYGMGFLNTMGEATFMGLTGKGKARLNFILDLDGRINGEGEILYPFYDGQYTTIFTQIGGRSMSGMDGGGKYGRGANRWIGNFGLGQRWYPGASLSADGRTIDSGNWMVGYNVFYDYDFTRSHQRGGVGIEARYDWLKLASNYYFPLSNWRGSYDYDSRFVKERAAQGWDLRVKGYLPFYRHVAVTGAYTQWFGDHVSMFSSRHLEKNPHVWNYGLEYTPIPLVSGFVNQRSTERGRNDTEFGLRFTYHFGLPWEEQVSPAKVQELRTVANSRHDFVDRENRIILEYKAKDDYHFEFAGRSGNDFTFRVRHAFDGYIAGQTVRVSATGVTSLAEVKTQPATFLAKAGKFFGDLLVSTAHAAGFVVTKVTGNNGLITVNIAGLGNSSTVTLQAGKSSKTFTGAELGASPFTISLSNGTPNPVVSGSSVITATVTDAGGNPVSGKTVTFTWKVKGGSQVQQAGGSDTTDASGKAAWTLNGTGDQRTITVTATVDGVSQSVEVQFGSALPSGFIALASSTMNWAAAGSYCANQGGKLPLIDGQTSISTVPDGTPTEGFGSRGATWPAGLPSDNYWTGTARTGLPGMSWFVLDGGGNVDVHWEREDQGTLRVVCVP